MKMGFLQEVTNSQAVFVKKRYIFTKQTVINKPKKN